MSEEEVFPSLEDSLIKSEYDKVIFHDVADWYSTDAHVQCKYTLTSGIQPTHGDRVALFKVGWVAPHQYLIYEWAPVPEQSSNPTEVLFQTKNLPKDDGEFYQFCYISSEGTIRGASIPFQFRRPHIDDLVEVEDDDNDLLIVRSRTAVMEEKMREVAEKNVELQKYKNIADRELEAEKEKHAEKVTKLKIYELEIKRLEKCLQEESNKQKEEVKRLKEELGLKIQNEMQQTERINELENTIKLITKQKEELTCKIITQSKEKDRLLKELAKLDGHLKVSNQHMEQISREQDSVTKYLQHEVERLEKTLREESQKVKDLQSVNVELEEGRERVIQQLLDTEHMLAAMEKSKYLATEEIMAHTEFKEKVTRDLEITRCDVHNLKCQLKNVQDENKKLLQENEKVQEEFSELQNKYSSIKARCDDLLNKEKNWQKEELFLKASVEDLTQRLKTGATEYHSKYIEALKLEKKVIKLKKKLQLKEKIQTDMTTTAEIKEEKMKETVSEESLSQSKTDVQEKCSSSGSEIAGNDKMLNDLKKDAVAFISYQQQDLHPYPKSSYYPYAIYRCSTNPFYYENKLSSKLPVPLKESPVGNEEGILDKPASNGLPPPLLPEVTPKAKLIAIAAMNRQIINQGESSSEESNCSIQNNTTYVPKEQVKTVANHDVTPKVCPICDLTFIGSEVDQLFQDHVEAHYGFDCPVCNAHYNPDQTAQLELHVQTHFSNNSSSIWKYQVNID